MDISFVRSFDVIEYADDNDDDDNDDDDDDRGIAQG